VGSVIPAAWSFMLAARARGLGTVWTTFHLRHEREAAELLGIPFEEVMQAALIPVAYTIGTEFRPAARHPLAWVTSWTFLLDLPALALLLLLFPAPCGAGGLRLHTGATPVGRTPLSYDPHSAKPGILLGGAAVWASTGSSARWHWPEAPA
jgi:hypothetical protein